ncbi:hypothetical protein [Nonomuraea maritima]|uniref:hypothetical protein n=1 Tax=Nonomuraea maritima TaxID=683260 RepID=UPI00371ED6C1
MHHPVSAGTGILLDLWLHHGFVVVPANLPLAVSPFPPIAALLATVVAGRGSITAEPTDPSPGFTRRTVQLPRAGRARRHRFPRAH